ncbi:pentapeptide repeat-containing protein [Streptosporangium fragile]|uniref:Pentapeptide repeat-containing protein n=1 Tax=Streptosporangium fragile TaxID=46186 RepID=A0ABN3VWL4_9ACTN
MADRKYGRPAPETHSTVASEDWYGDDLSGQSHERVAFVDMDMTETESRGAVFSECTFHDVRFNASTHVDTAFLNCTFVRCTFFDATFTSCKFVGSMFDRCTFDLLKVSGGDWSFAGLPGADLHSASFVDVRLREADLTGARCEGAVLRGVDLTGAWLHSAKLSRCDLRGSELSSLDPFNVEVRGAIVDVQQAVVIAEALGLEVRPG